MLLSDLPAAAPASLSLYGWSESSLLLRVKITNAPLPTGRGPVVFTRTVGLHSGKSWPVFLREAFSHFLCVFLKACGLSSLCVGQHLHCCVSHPETLQNPSRNSPLHPSPTLAFALPSVWPNPNRWRMETSTKLPSAAAHDGMN